MSNKDIALDITKANTSPICLNFKVTGFEGLHNIAMAFNIANFNNPFAIFQSNDYTLDILITERVGSNVKNHVTSLSLLDLDLEGVCWNQLYTSKAYEKLLMKINQFFTKSRDLEQSNSKSEKVITTIHASLHDTRKDLYLSNALVQFVIF